MASLISHAVAALGIGTIFAKPGVPYRVWIIGVACSVIPDADVIGFRLGVHYGDFWGHRGFTHSLLFSAIIASLATIVGFFRQPPKSVARSLGSISSWPPQVTDYSTR
jgi:inner membrane protein